MNILIVTQYFWPEDFRINDLAVGLVGRGHRVTVLSGIPNYPNGSFFHGYGIFSKLHEDYNGVKILRVALVPRGKGGGFRLVLNYLSFALFGCLLAPFLCRDHYDSILVFQLSPITSGFPAIIMKWLRSIPLLFWIQDIWPESLAATGAVRSKKVLNLVNHIVRFIYKECDLILVQSKAFISLVEKQGISSDRIVYLPNSYENIFKPISVKERDIHLPTGFRIMFAGNIGAAQDFPTIISAAIKLKQYTDIQWIILGDGRRRAWLEQEVEKQGLTKCLHLLGRQPMESMPSYFAAADALLVTLKKEPVFTLTIPSKIQSYMACGRPIIAALDGEGGNLINDSGAGLSVPAGNPVALAEAVLTMRRMSKEERDTMGMRGREYCEANFSREMLIDRLEGWMNELVTKKRPSAC